MSLIAEFSAFRLESTSSEALGERLVRKPHRPMNKKLVLFCEGGTEYNYFDGIRKLPNVAKLIRVRAKIESRDVVVKSLFIFFALTRMEISKRGYLMMRIKSIKAR